MGLLTPTLTAARLGARTMRMGLYAATFPARAVTILTLVTYEELLDVAERAELVEPPDPPPAQVLVQAQRRRRRRRPAA